MEISRYSLEWFDYYSDELLDKMGSDLFPLAIKYNRFKSLTLEFIDSTLKYFEVTQKASDDIKDLVVKSKMPVVREDLQLVWETAEPTNYYRLISIVPFFLNSDDKEVFLAKKPSILKEGQRLMVNRDPFNEPTDEYPNVYRSAKLFQIDTGRDSSTQYSSCLITYVKKPTFALMAKPDERIVNLHDSAIERIILKTVDSLRFSTGDPSSLSNYQFNQQYGDGKTNSL